MCGVKKTVLEGSKADPRDYDSSQHCQSLMGNDEWKCWSQTHLRSKPASGISAVRPGARCFTSLSRHINPSFLFLGLPTFPPSQFHTHLEFPVLPFLLLPILQKAPPQQLQLHPASHLAWGMMIQSP